MNAGSISGAPARQTLAVETIYLPGVSKYHGKWVQDGTSLVPDIRGHVPFSKVLWRV